ncbi:sensor histidine kinase [Pontibacter actiniarum]|uniref:Signal transduction histidine kinase internal region domain-containing protein n=1 Tax=Pontibacter actiniarum TaxID=323450 RepID=A0A1X9YR28_9BACT|nr:histidine kinase [Pontibacter actiniarum]ARS35301.1 hypothetical protein CA264_07525 [Pontibacter actiniarum]
MKSFWQRHLIVLLHLSFWAVYLFFSIFNVVQYNSFGRALLYTGVTAVFHVVICYYNYFQLLPRFMRQRRLLPYLLRLVPALALVVAARVLVEKQMYGSLPTDMPYLVTVARVVQVAMGMLFMLAFIALLRFTTEWLVLEGRRRELENQQMAAELKFLRAQVNPHFLFNTLNSLYYLAYTKSDQAPEVIDRLSQMMRYMIYEANHKLVPLEHEIRYMQHYIDLEKMRLTQQVHIQFDVCGVVEGVQVAPFLFMTFLENAFKHGVNPNGQGDWVLLQLQVRQGVCYFALRNSKGNARKNEFSESSGMGLQNVRRRLELSYPNRHELQLRDNPEAYEVNLNLQLN